MRGFLRILNDLGKRIFLSPLAKERFFLLLIITVLVIIWFHRGLMVGSGESGLPFYNTQKLLELSKNSWTDVPLGTSSAIGFANFPFYAVVTFLGSLGIPPFLIQAGVYWVLLAVGTLAIHYLAAKSSGNNRQTRLISSLFYIFNPIIHINVLHRVQYPLMFFYGFLPLAFIVYSEGLNRRSFWYLIILNLLCLVFSFAFIGPSFMILLFAIFGLYSLLKSLEGINKRKFQWYPILYLVAFWITFAMVGAWWLIPFFTSVSTDLGVGAAVKYFNANANIDTFKSISEHLGSVVNILRMVPQEFYEKNGSSWGYIFYTPPFIILSFFTIFGFTFSLFRRKTDLNFRFLVLTSLLLLFFSKGSLPPFGWLTLFIFKSLTFLQVLRNPFEKAGLILPFTLAIPVGFGTWAMIEKISEKVKVKKALLTLIFLAVIFPIYMFPIANGYVFTGGGPPADDLNIGQYVKVPDYYIKAREWLNGQQDLFRVLVLPLDGEGMTYKWDFGYSGVELSNNLFDQSMISFNTSQGFLPEMIDSIKHTFNKFPDKIWILSQMLNVRFIMVRDDIDFIARETETPTVVLSSIEKFLDKHFRLAAEFGKLKLFELKKEEFYPRVFSSTTSIFLAGVKKNSLDLMPFSNPIDHDIFITSSGSEKKDDSYLKLSSQVLVTGTRVKNLDVKTGNPIENLPYVSVYRNTPMYALVRLKEEIESQLLTPDNQLSYQVNLMGKRLAEINHTPNETSAVEEYSQLLKTISQEIYKEGVLDEGIASVLINQRYAIDQLKNNVNEKDVIDKLAKDLDQLLIGIGIKPVFPSQKEIITRLYVPRDSIYEILVPSEDWETYYLEHGIDAVEIDGNAYKVDSKVQSRDLHTFVLGSYHLSAGLHEINISQPTAINLLAEKLPEELTLSSADKKPLVKSVPVLPLNNNYTYRISFEYMEEKGNVPIVAVHSDADFVNVSGEKIARFGIALKRSDYDFGWKKYQAVFTPFPSANNHSVMIKILPYGDCKAVVQRPYRRYCEDNSFNQKYLLDSSTKFRNFKVEKVFLNPLMLREVGSRSAHGSAPTISFENISPAKYKVKVSDAKNPFFLVLSTTYDPKWSAFFTDSRDSSLMEKMSETIPGDLVQSQNHLIVNGYANGWYIDKSGDFDMYLEYTPVRASTIGRKISTIAVVFFALGFIARLVYVKYSHR